MLRNSSELRTTQGNICKNGCRGGMEQKVSTTHERLYRQLYISSLPVMDSTQVFGGRINWLGALDFTRLIGQTGIPHRTRQC